MLISCTYPYEPSSREKQACNEREIYIRLPDFHLQACTQPYEAARGTHGAAGYIAWPNIDTTPENSGRDVGTCVSDRSRHRSRLSRDAVHSEILHLVDLVGGLFVWVCPVHPTVSSVPHTAPSDPWGASPPGYSPLQGLDRLPRDVEADAQHLAPDLLHLLHPILVAPVVFELAYRGVRALLRYGQELAGAR